MQNQIFYRGTIIEFYNPTSYNPGIEKFILADCLEEGSVFQIICINGYNSGSLEGYVKIESELERKNKKAISYSHLLHELKRNFGNINFETLKIEN